MLSPGESLEKQRQDVNVQGTRLERLVEKFKGIDVYDAVVTVRQTSDGQLTGDASGTIIQGIGEDLNNTDGKLSDHETLLIAAKR